MAQAETDAVADVREDTRWYLAFLTMTVILQFLSFPYLLGVILTAPLAAFFAGRALFVTRREPNLIRFRIGTTLGLAISTSLFVGALAMAVLFPAYAERANCLERALTNQATQQCEAQFLEDLPTITPPQ